MDHATLLSSSGLGLLEFSLLGFGIDSLDILTREYIVKIQFHH
jgi:hypothetical protein